MTLIENYFAVLKRFSSYILITWLIAFVVCVIYGPEFLNQTRSDFKLPSSLPSTKALNEYKANYPDASPWSPNFVVYYSESDGGIISNITHDISAELDSQWDQYNYVSSVSGYWENIGDPDLHLLAESSVNSDNTTMLTTISYGKSATNKDITDNTKKLLEFTRSKSTSEVFVGVTGLFALFQEMVDATTTNFELIDATVLPIGLIILGFNVNSYKHIILALFNLLLSLLLSFAILNPISKAAPIDPFAPTIMMSLGVAICFDYSLFLLNRFREERRDKARSLDEAVLTMLSSSGHVIAFSASILFLTFVILIIFPQPFLKSVGISCSVLVFSTSTICLSLTPCFLLTFACFSDFQMLPFVSDTFVIQVFSSISGMQIEKETASTSKEIIPDQTDGGTANFCCLSRAVDHGNRIVASNPEYRRSAVSEPPDASNVDHIEDKPEVTYVSIIKRRESLCFRLAMFSTSHRILIATVTAVITAILLWKAVVLKATSDNTIIYLRGSNSLKSYEIMRSNFPIGSLDPYYVLVDTSTVNAVYSQEYFDLETTLVEQIMSTQSPRYVDSSSFTSLSYYNGAYFNYSDYIACNTNSSSMYNSDTCSGYRFSTSGLANYDGSVSQIIINTIIDPDSEAIAQFIIDVRNLLESFDSSTFYQNAQLKTYLYGGYTFTLDLQILVYSLVPYLISATLLLVMVLIGIDPKSFYLMISQ